MQSQKREQPRKEPYASPELLVHGSMQEITRDTGGKASDVPGGSSFTGPPTEG